MPWLVLIWNENLITMLVSELGFLFEIVGKLNRLDLDLNLINVTKK